MNTRSKVTVLGAGHGGLTFAGDLTLRGYDVTLFELPRFNENIKPIQEQGGFEISGHDGLGRPMTSKGFAKIHKVTTNIEEAVNGAKVLMIIVPAFAHSEFAEKIAPYLEEEQIVILNPGSQLGAIEFGKRLREKGVDIDNEVILGETMSLLYATRKFFFKNENIYRVWVMAIKAIMPFSTFPSKNTSKTINIIQDIFHSRLTPAENVFETGLNSLNAYAHPTFMILGAIDMEAGEDPEWSIFHERRRSSQAVKNVLTSMQKEKNNLVNAMNLTVKEYNFYPEGWWDPPYKNSYLPPPYEVGGNKLRMRYLTEDIPYGLIPVSSPGKMINVSTPTIDAVIQLASIINQTDYQKKGRTVEKLGISGFTVEQLIKFVS
jgi:opine dehydrogenase